MSSILVAVIGILALLILLACGMNIGIAMMFVGVIGISILARPKTAIMSVASIPSTQGSTYTYAVIPLFVLMGQFAYVSGISSGLFDFANKWLGSLRGGLAIATIAACAAFSAICGSTAATAATMSVIALPQMRDKGYQDSLSCGSIAAGGTLGILIPPSTAFILYGIVAGESIGALFMAGIVPGIVLALCYIISIAIQVRRHPELAPGSQSFTWKERLISVKGALSMVILFGVVIGGMMTNFFSANEAAAVGAVVSLIFVIVNGKFTWKVVGKAFLDSVKTSAMVLLILIGAYVFGNFLALSGMPKVLANWIISMGFNRYVVILLILILYVILGCFMDSLAMVVLTVPIFLPIVQALGFDAVWYGVLMIMVMECGLITPPVGMNVYIVAGIAKDVSLGTIFKGVTPMIFGMLVAVLIVAFIPQVSLWLPTLCGY